MQSKYFVSSKIVSPQAKSYIPPALKSPKNGDSIHKSVTSPKIKKIKGFPDSQELTIDRCQTDSTRFQPESILRNSPRRVTASFGGIYPSMDQNSTEFKTINAINNENKREAKVKILWLHWQFQS